MRDAKKYAFAVFMLLISVIALIYGLLSSSFASLPPASGRIMDYSGPISVYIDGEYQGDAMAPISRRNLRPFANLTFSLTVPDYVEAGDAVAIRKNSAKFNVFLDEELIFSYYPDAKESGRPEYGYGTTFYIPLREDASGKTLRIETVEAPAVSGISLAYVEFGDFASMEIETLLWEIEPIIVSYILTFAAFIAAVTSCFAKERETRKSLLSSAFLVFIIALWLFFQSRSRQYIVHNTVLPAMVSYFCIFFFPYALYSYFIYNYPLSDARRLKGFRYAAVAFIICFYLIGLLSHIGVYGYAEALTAVTTFVVTYLAFLFIYVSYLFFRKKERVGIFIIIVSIMIVSFLIEWILLLLGININTSITLEVLACSTIAILFKSLSLYLLETKERVEKKAALALAYSDPLTGLRNRGSYDSLLSQPWHGDRFIDVFVIDVNNLKRINDTLGHSAGNDLLKRVSGAIIETFPYFKQLGYRTGGDEFVVFSPSGLSRDPDILVEKLKEKLKGEDESDVISVGYVSIDTRKISLRMAVDMADAEMYDDKKSEKKS